MVKREVLIGIFIFLLLIPLNKTEGKGSSYSPHGKFHLSTIEVFELPKTINPNNANKQLLTATCKVKINGEINGVKIEGEIVIEGITIWECMVIKINDLFDKRY